MHIIHNNLYLFTMNVESAIFVMNASSANGQKMATYHLGDVIMCVMASQITSITIAYSTFYSGAENTKLRVTGLCAGNSPVTGELPAQMASNAEMFPLSKWPTFCRRHFQMQDFLILIRLFFISIVLCRSRDNKSALVQITDNYFSYDWNVTVMDHPSTKTWYW